MENNNDILMDTEELASWRAQRGLNTLEAKDSLKGTEMPKKMTVSKLNLILLEAALKGNLTVARQALSDGAFPNVHSRANPGDTPFTIAIEAGHDVLALELLRAGSWPSPARWSNELPDFDQAAASGVFTEQARALLAQRVMKLCSVYTKSFDVFKAMRDWCEPSMSDCDLIGMALAQDRYDLALKGVRAGISLTSQAWEQAEKRMKGRCSSLKKQTHRRDLLDLLATPSAVATMTQNMCESFYSWVVKGDDTELALVLLDAGLRPNKEWAVAAQSDPYDAKSLETKLPLLVLAAGLDQPELFELFKTCSPVMNAAKGVAIPPGALVSISIGKLIELRDSGVNIEGRDPKGNALPHLWARYDHDSRSGWATLAKKVPTLFDIKNKQGKTGADLMMDKLGDFRKKEFLASLSRIEMREIKQELGPKPKNMVVSVRSRL